MKILYFALILLLSSEVYSQNDIKVDPLTGRPLIDIPIYDLKYGDLSVPVHVAHHGNSLRVDESEGSCGMGWTLVAGGSISRIVRGLPDDYPGSTTDLRRGWLFDNNAQIINNFTPSSDDNLSLCNDEQLDWNFINNLAYLKDPEPDLFSFQAPGISGQFVFDVDGTPKLIPYQDLKIEPSKDANGQITQFTITTNLGVIYNFSVKESTSRQAKRYKTFTPVSYFKTDFTFYTSKLDYTSSWNISSMKSPAGAMVTFGYQASSEINSPNFYTTIDQANVVDTTYYLQDKVIPKILNLISTGSSISTVSFALTISFSWSKNGLLNQIEIKESQNSDNKIFNFSYKTAYSSTDTSWPRVIRHFLAEIKQINSCNPFPPYSFSYNGVYDDLLVSGNYVVPFPFSKRNKADLWGFFNANSLKNIPTIYFYNGAVGAERFRTEPFAGSSPTLIVAGDDRQANYYSDFGSVNEITYPSGGVTQITYEPHKYFDAVASTEFSGGGVRVREIITSGGLVSLGKSIFGDGVNSIKKEYEYLALDGKSSGKLIYHPVYAFVDGNNIIRSVNNLSCESSSILYERFSEKVSGKGKTVLDFNVSGYYPLTTQGDWNATLSKIARKPGTSCIPSGNIKNGPYTFPFAANTNYDFERGLLNHVSVYSEDNVLTSERLFTYARSPQTATKIKGLRYEEINDIFHFGLYEILTSVNKVKITETLREYDEITPVNFLEKTSTYSYSNRHYLLESITQQNSDGSTSTQKIKYAKDFDVITNPSNAPARAVQKLLALNMHGSVIENIQSLTPIGGSSSPIGSQIIIYKDFGNNQIMPYNDLIFPKNTSFQESSVLSVGASQQFIYDSVDYITSSYTASLAQRNLWL